MHLDVARSQVIIAERAYPAVCVVCPPTRCCFCKDDEDEWNHMLGGPSHGPFKRGWDVFIPLEHNCIINVEWHDDGKVWVDLHTSWVHLIHEVSDGKCLWLPEALTTRGGELVKGWSQHCDPEEEWLVEWIKRVQGMLAPPKPQEDMYPKMISLTQAWAMWEDHYKKED